MIPGVVASQSSEFIPGIGNFEEVEILQHGSSGRVAEINSFAYVEEVGLYIVCGGYNSGGLSMSQWDVYPQVAYSTDAFSWSISIVYPFVDYSLGSGKGGGSEVLSARDIAYKDGIFLVADAERRAIARTTDITDSNSWQIVSGFDVYDSNRNNQYLLADNDKFYLYTGATSNRGYQESTNGLVWTTTSNPFGKAYNNSASPRDVYSVFGAKPLQHNKNLSNGSSSFIYTGQPAAAGNGITLETYSNKTRAYFSDDSYQEVLDFEFSQIRFVGDDGSGYFVGRNGEDMLYSKNGIDWKELKNPKEELYSSVFSNSSGSFYDRGTWYHANGKTLIASDNSERHVISRTPFQIR